MTARTAIAEMYRTQPLVFGHRGAKVYAPMNTLPAFELAARQGAHGIELDVHRSRDGHPVVIHDFTVDATTDGTGPVASLSLADLRTFDAGAWFGPQFAGVRVPTLDEVFEAVGRRLLVNVEIKAEGEETDGVEEVVAACIRRHGMAERVVVSSFEDIHQLRVATRRLRASLQVVAPCFDQRAIRRFRRGLRHLAAALGAVRDRDVFLEHLRYTQEALPAAEREQLTRLQVSVAQERATARQALLVRLDSPRYARFKEAFATFLSTPGAGVGPLPATGQPLRVRDLAGSLLWGRYEALRAFEPVLLASEEVIQHEARIAGKRLRYTTECFAEAIGGGGGRAAGAPGRPSGGAGYAAGRGHSAVHDRVAGPARRPGGTGIPRPAAHRAGGCPGHPPRALGAGDGASLPRAAPGGAGGVLGAS